MMSQVLPRLVLILGFVGSSAAIEKPDLESVSEALARAADTKSRMDAARVLGSSGDARAAAPLIRALKDPSRPVRWSAIEALGELHDRSAVPALLEYLGKKEPYRWGRTLTINALASIGDPNAADAVLTIYEGQDLLVQRVILMGLAKLGDERAVPIALGLLDDEVAWMRKTAQAALVQLSRGRIQGEVPRGREAWARWYENNPVHPADAGVRR